MTRCLTVNLAGAPLSVPRISITFIPTFEGNPINWAMIVAVFPGIARTVDKPVIKPDTVGVVICPLSGDKNNIVTCAVSPTQILNVSHNGVGENAKGGMFVPILQPSKANDWFASDPKQLCQVED